MSVHLDNQKTCVWQRSSVIFESKAQHEPEPETDAEIRQRRMKCVAATLVGWVCVWKWRRWWGWGKPRGDTLPSLFHWGVWDADGHDALSPTLTLWVLLHKPTTGQQSRALNQLRTIKGARCPSKAAQSTKENCCFDQYLSCKGCRHGRLMDI